MKKFSYFLPFVILLVIFFHQIIFTGQTFFLRDLIEQFHPWRNYAREVLLKGEIPLWNPYTFCGIPFLANLQSAIFYPFTLTFYFFNFLTAYKTFLILHFLLAGFFMYWLLVEWGLEEISCLLGAIVFAFNGYLLTRVEFLSDLGTAIWLPLILLLFKKGREDKFSIWFIFLVFILSFSFFSGQPQTFFLEIFFLAAYAVFSCWEKKQIKPLLMFVSAGLLSLLLSFCQFLPSLEFYFHSSWQSRSFADAIVYSLKPQELLTFLKPYHFYPPAVDLANLGLFKASEYWIKSFYVGILPLFLSFVALLRREKTVYFFWFMLLLSIFLSFGKFLPFYPVIFQYTPFRLIRYPARIMYLAIFCISFLSAAGNNYLFSFAKVMKTPLLLRRNYSDGEYSCEARLIVPLVLRSRISQKIKLLGNESLVKRIKTIVLGIVVFDLFSFGVRLNPTSDGMIFEQSGETVKFLQENSFLERFFLTPKTERNRRIRLPFYRDGLFSNLNMSFHLYNFGGQDLEIQEQAEFLTAVKNLPSPHTATKLLGLANVKYLISLSEIKSDYYTLKKTGERKIYENKKCLPRLFVIPKAKTLPKKQILPYLTNEQFKPTEELIIEEEVKEDLSRAKEKLTNLAKIVEYKPQKIGIYAQLNSPAWLFLSDSYYPGWKVYVDGQKDRIYRANYAFRALYLKPGNHNVLLIYDPLSFKVGLFVSVVVFSALLCSYFILSSFTKVSR